METYTNSLISETSPYLLQHAHNPVNWEAWSTSVFERAKKENKLVLISVGYSACHWCHVMEHECFEDEEVATLMNKFFINIKVDREERPDVDQLYMTAVQLMTNKGGWPLNCFTLPDGRPIYGGTYFPKEQWMHILRSLEHTYRNDKEKVEQYAAELMEGVAASETIVEPNDLEKFEKSKLDELLLRWKRSFDHRNGGPTRAPKFPLPSNLDFLLDHALHIKDEELLKYVYLTLDNMAMGGIYDQVGGGFARYSVDMLWKIPHFEKMLYDNGQLLSTYSKAFAVSKNPMYKRIVEQTIAWLEREMMDGSGAFISAIDADSEGMEGKFYIWTLDELTELDQLSNGFLKHVYDLGDRAYWEDGYYVLLRTSDDRTLSRKLRMSNDEFQSKLMVLNELLLSKRNEREFPGKDDKCLTSWNAMTLKGICEAARIFKDDAFRMLALRNYRWLTENMIAENGSLMRNYKNGAVKIEGFLEDYAAVIDALIAYYYLEGDAASLELADRVLTYCLNDFYDDHSVMFYFTPQNTELIARKMEINDNVIPSGNSVMARNLYQLSILLHKREYQQMSEKMLANVYDGMETYGSGYSNWALLLNHIVFGVYSFICTGHESRRKALELVDYALPFSVIVHLGKGELLQLFSDYDIGRDGIYVCTESRCLSPVKEAREAYELVLNNEV